MNRVPLESEYSPYKPHTDAATWVAVTVTLPRNWAWLFVKAFIASSAMLKLVEWSIASTLIVLPLNVRAQQVPHAAELKPVTATAPPMKGKLGNDPNVVNPFVSRPF